MDVALITGSTGLIGSEAVGFFDKKGFKVLGVDNNMRKYFFGQDGCTEWNKTRIFEQVPGYEHFEIDIRTYVDLENIFKTHGKDVKLIIHTAAQPSHDWAAKEPLTDFSVNATGTLNLLELTRLYCPSAIFIFTSTNKVYGDLPNTLPLVERDTRWEIEETHAYFDGIDEQMSIDQSKHSLFGASKVAADVLVQEYGRYFNMKTACFRGGCLTGPNHSGAMLHGFLAYLMKCCVTGSSYSIFGYKGKQVRDNIHSEDLIEAFYEFYSAPRVGEVYNIGGGRENSISILEAISLSEKISGKKFNSVYKDQNRSGDHIWYISSLKKFMSHYPSWHQKHTVTETLQEIYDKNVSRWAK